ncbi:MAG: hypothetical protein IKN14_05255 [Clostridiales bacterium]|nr:hypothetical protein [Clostridiales bacterium]
MKLFRKITVMMLVLTLSFGMFACSDSKKKKDKDEEEEEEEIDIGPDALADAAEEYGADELDADDLADEIEDLMYSDYSDYKDGVYAKDDDMGDLNDLLRSFDIYDKHMEEGTVFFQSDAGSKSSYCKCLVISVVFRDEDDAEDYYEDMAEDLEDMYDTQEDSFDVMEFETDDDDLRYAILTYSRENLDCSNLGVYLSGEDVLVIMEYGSDDCVGAAAKICKELDIKAPSKAKS